MDLITLDFETYYASDYGLRKLTTEEYIRDERFETIGVSVKVNDEEAAWFSGTKKQTKKFLDQYAWDSSVAIAHNARFDMAILNWHFDIRPKRIADTLSMARAIHGTEVGGSLAALALHYNIGVKGEEVVHALGKRRLDFTKEELSRYGAYCINDTNIAYQLFKILGAGFPLNELKLIDLTVRMFTEPVLELEEQDLSDHLEAVIAQKQKFLDGVAATREELMSNPKFAKELSHLGVVPPTKISALTGKETFAFAKADAEFTALLEHPSPHVQALVAARLGTKSTIEETRTQRFLDIAKRGTLPIPLRYYAAHTGRWGGDDKINMQNLPRTSPLKYCIRAPEGHVLVDSDSSQIEARTLAWLAGQTDLVDAFERGDDVYKIMASSIYGKSIEDITPQERFVGKTTILGAGYGMGPPKFQNTLANAYPPVEISTDESERVIRVYRERYPRIPQLWRQAGHEVLPAILGGNTTPFGVPGALSVEGIAGIRLPNGLYIRYPNLRWEEAEAGERPQYRYDTKRGRATFRNKIYGGKVVENVCQALARIIIGEQMLMIAKKFKIAMTVHDAATCIVPEHEKDTGQEFIELCMRIRPSWAPGLPLDCEAGWAKNYGECK